MIIDILPMIFGIGSIVISLLVVGLFYIWFNKEDNDFLFNDEENKNTKD